MGARQVEAGSIVFEYTDGTNFDNDTWHAGEPNTLAGSGIQCIDMGPAYQSYEMLDWPCWQSLPFICEGEFIVVSSTVHLVLRIDNQLV